MEGFTNNLVSTSIISYTNTIRTCRDAEEHYVENAYPQRWDVPIEEAWVFLAG